MPRPNMRGAWTALWTDPNDPNSPSSPSDVLGRWSTEEERCDVLDAYVANESLYRLLAAGLNDQGYVGYKGLRNPAARLIGLYAAKLTDKLIASLDAPDPLKGQLEQIYEWSSWEDRSEEAARDLTTYGIVFVKVENNEDMSRVQFNLLDPRHVTEFTTDAREILTYLRLDVPFEEDAGDGEVDELCRTEIWDKELAIYRAWEHDLDPGASLQEIADVQSGHSQLVASAYLAESAPEGAPPGANVTGYDFIPVVLRRLGKSRHNERGRGVFQHALDAIDEINRQATKLSEMMFPDIYRVFERDPSARGGDLPPIHLQNEDSARALSRAQQEGYRVVDQDGVKTVRLPSGGRFAWAIPSIDFQGHLSAMDNFTRESIEKDIPELAYYRLREMTDVSGRAAIILMMDVSDRIMAVRHKFEDMVVRLGKMALTIARTSGIQGFEGVGDYESGALDHAFKPYVLFPVSALEQAQEGQAEAAAIAAYQALPAPVFRRFLEKQGYEEQAIEEILRNTSAATPSPSTSVLDTILQRRQESRETP